jgi:hypothetical protein
VSTNKLFFTTLLGWPLLVGSVLTVRTAAANPSVSLLELAGWGFLAGVPVAIALVLGGGRATTSVAHVLYEAEHVSADGPKNPA